MEPYRPPKSVVERVRTPASPPGCDKTADQAFDAFKKIFAEPILRAVDEICAYCGEKSARDLDHFRPKGKPSDRSVVTEAMNRHGRALSNYAYGNQKLLSEFESGYYGDYFDLLFSSTDDAGTRRGYPERAADPHNLIPACVSCNQRSSSLWYHGIRFTRGKHHHFPLLDAREKAMPETFIGPHEKDDIEALIDPATTTWSNLTNLFRFVDFEGGVPSVNSGSTERTAVSFTRSTALTLIVPADSGAEDGGSPDREMRQRLLRAATTIELLGLNSKRHAEARWAARRLAKLELSGFMENASHLLTGIDDDAETFVLSLGLRVDALLSTSHHRLAVMDALAEHIVAFLQRGNHSGHTDAQWSAYKKAVMRSLIERLLHSSVARETWV